jgi:hypothetical protein
MKNEPQVQVEIQDVTTGLWVWRLKNPFWEPSLDWEPLTASTCVESGGETLVLDPQIPPPEAVEGLAAVRGTSADRSGNQRQPSL